MGMRQQRGIFAIVFFTIRNIFLYQPQPCGLSTWKKGSYLFALKNTSLPFKVIIAMFKIPFP